MTILGFSPLFWLKVLVVAAAFYAGWYVNGKFCDAEKLEAVNAARLEEQRQHKVVIKTETVVQEKIVKVREKGKVVYRDIPKYITVEVEKACPQGLPAGYVRVHDAAATGESAGPATESDAHPTGITLAQAGSVVTDNYTEYNACREQVIGWNRFYDDIKKGKE